MMRKALTAAAMAGMVLVATPSNAADKGVEAVYREALECRVAADSLLISLNRQEAANEEQAKAIETVKGTESFYRRLTLMLGRKLGKRDPLIGMDYAQVQLGVTQSILTKPNAMADMVSRTKTCGEAISEAEKA
ncbi:hypothetical protein [Erythrobacter dokdonensis]|uniref:Uncharacterized protein n=1 Tax=Erythrobacter dokdonensis DSW-74 TaxID=1300349 RepID=A0A1A7BG83_9SPHN|nr:hypothetical protein [Erythrobacter dokdonensis]OBV10225.1 hypothetical protein I603_2187 [Erythrobacter dokdonensis DSW-74]